MGCTAFINKTKKGGVAHLTVHGFDKEESGTDLECIGLIEKRYRQD